MRRLVSLQATDGGWVPCYTYTSPYKDLAVVFDNVRTETVAVMVDGVATGGASG